MQTHTGPKKRERKLGRKLVREQTRPSGIVPPCSNNRWRIVCAAILVAAGLVRVLYLTARPLHHDEGVNGYFLANLFRGGSYNYDPTNYHGPTLYHFALLTTTLNAFVYGKDGLSTFAIRIVPALFGIAIVWLTLGFRRNFGTFGTIAAALLLASSPGEVFFSRYFIHEIPFVCFALGLVVALLRYRERGNPHYLVLAVLSGALLCATKETWLITLPVLFGAYGLSLAYVGLRTRHHRSAQSKSIRSLQVRELTNETTTADEWRWILRAGMVFVFVWVALYSSFFSNFPRGVYDSVLTFETWGRTGTTAYVSPWFTYLKWLCQEELPSVVLGAIGIGLALWQSSNRFAIFLALWALVIAAVYSLIPYKTPWLTLNISLPLAIIAGYGLGRCYEIGKARGWIGLRAAAIVALAASVLLSAYQAIGLSFFRYDDDTLSYSYAHTSRDFLGLVDDIGSVETDNHLGTDMGITVMSPEHWPLFWYLRQDPNVAYEGKLVETKEPVIIALDSQSASVEQRFGQQYRRLSSHVLRHGNTLVLYLRRDLMP